MQLSGSQTKLEGLFRPAGTSQRPAPAAGAAANANLADPLASFQQLGGEAAPVESRAVAGPEAIEPCLCPPAVQACGAAEVHIGTDHCPCVSMEGCSPGEPGTASESAVLEQPADTAAPQEGSGAVSVEPSVCQPPLEVCGAAQAQASPAHAPGVSGASTADQPAVLRQPADGTASPLVEASPCLPALQGYRPRVGGGQLQKKARFTPVAVKSTAEGPSNRGRGFLRRGACSVHTSLVKRWLLMKPRLLYGARAVSGRSFSAGQMLRGWGRGFPSS